MLQNPILKGFKPDPAILRVEDTYYIATSTFEWFPPINIFQSKDLAHWVQIPSPIQDDLVLNFKGIDTSCGIWAPNLAYHDGTFYLICTVVDTNRRRFKDPRNFVITASSMQGPWSTPTFLNNSGWDPSLFFEDDGRCYFINMLLDYRPEKNRFAGVVLQELNLKTLRLTGPVHFLSTGTEVGSTEGPNLYKRGSYYYLVLAEGGTEFNHQVSILRASSLFGLYKESPYNPILTSNPEDFLQRAGHGSFTTTPEDRTYMIHLCSRSVDHKYSILGRETAIQEIRWTEDQWPVLSSYPSRSPENEIGFLHNNQESKLVINIDFSKSNWDVRIKTLREGKESCGLDLFHRPGWLRIKGGNSLSSKYRQHLLAIPQETFNLKAITKMEFRPRSFMHLAGLFAYYNADNYYYSYMSTDDNGKYILSVLVMDNMKVSRVGKPIEISTNNPLVYLRAEIHTKELFFSYSFDGKSYHTLHDFPLNMCHLSDEYIKGNGFTGAMLGIGCQDLAGDGIHADFAYLHYHEL